jgi:hypothetical protein
MLRIDAIEDAMNAVPTSCGDDRVDTTVFQKVVERSSAIGIGAREEPPASSRLRVDVDTKTE